MTPLESKISQLLVDAEGLLEPARFSVSKWVATSSTESQLQTVDDKNWVTLTWGRAHSKLKVLPSYIAAQQAFERDPAFANAVRGAGYWATFDPVIQTVLAQSASIKNGRVAIDHSGAIDRFREIRTTLSAGHLRFEARARFLGVEIEAREICLPDEVKLVRLTPEEIAERQPTVMPGFDFEYSGPELLRQGTEIRVPVTVPVERMPEGEYKENAFFNASNAAQKVTQEMFGNILHAVLVAMPGHAALGPVDLEGGALRFPIGRSMVRERHYFPSIKIDESKVAKIATAYEFVSGGGTTDKTLSRALHRFLLGRLRPDLIDKLVDYVIAWEAVLLTQSGNALAQELSYRFSVNGASLISAIEGDSNQGKYFQRMLSAYRTRSAIVHGGSDEERDRALETGSFSNIGELCIYLEDTFRKVVFWLSALAVEKRLYRAVGGWEALIWPQS